MAVATDARRRLEVSLQNPGRRKGFERARLTEWLRRLVGELSPDADSFCLRLIGDEEMRRLNLRFRGRDATTDVLSFPGEPSPEGRHLGDVVISVPTARGQAAASGHPLERELRILALHGVLHCLGYDHETDDGEMDRFEQSLRRRWMGGASA